MAQIRLRHPDTGQPLVFGVYDDSHCLRLTDLLPDGQDFDGVLNLKNGGNVCRTLGAGSKARLARKVVLHFLALLVDELMATGDHYQLPVRGLARIRIVGKSRQTVRSIARRDKYPMVDLEKSRGMIYEMVLELTKNRRPVKRTIRMNRGRYEKLCARANNGQVYDRA